MTSIDKAPASVRGWVAAERSADPRKGRRAVVTADVGFDKGPFQPRGADAVLDVLDFMMPAGWLGAAVEWDLLPVDSQGRVTARATSPGGGPLQIHVPGDLGPPETVNAVDMIFTLNADGLITWITGGAHHILEAPGLAQPPKPGETPPDFVLPDVFGTPVPLRHDGTKATAVVFTCNNCPYSRAWHDRLQQVARDYAGRGVRFLQINPNDPIIGGANELPEHSLKRVKAGEFAGPYLLDEGQVMARRWGARHTPEVFVLDARGLVAYHGAPDADSSDDSLNAAWLRGALDRVLAGTTPDPAQTKPEGCSIKWTPQ